MYIFRCTDWVMDKTVIMEKLSSAAAFVEGGVQDACDDACSICLENFCESDPSTVNFSLSFRCGMPLEFLL